MRACKPGKELNREFRKRENKKEESYSVKLTLTKGKEGAKVEAVGRAAGRVNLFIYYKLFTII